jgi:predicted GH43/DUF377 family glycosyl hydrolase
MKINYLIISITLSLFFSCTSKEDGYHRDFNSLKQIASTEGFKPYEGNPVISPGSVGTFDAGALGSMTILKVEDTFHIYYEGWGVRSEKEWDAAEYETLQIGHATSKDGIHWTKDPNNPVLTQGKEGEWDATGVWDPYVIYEDGLFKMWYGGGGGMYPNYGWAYAVSEDGSNFEKKGLIGKNNRSDVEDVHVVHDKKSGLYFLYYWHGHEEGEDLFYVTSTDFDFSKSVIVNIKGDDSFWKKFGHVLRNDEGWFMFYSNYVAPHGRNSIIRFAVSEDGINWKAKNKRLLYGLGADVLQVTKDLFVMVYAPENHFDKKDADIRIAVYNGRLSDLTTNSTLINEIEPTSITGKEFTTEIGEDGLHTFYFKHEGEVVISDEEGYAFNAFYKQVDENVYIMGESLEIKGTYDGETFKLIE